MVIIAEKTDAELNDGKLPGGIFGFEVPNIESVEFEGLAPWSSSDAIHLKIDGDEIGSTGIIRFRADLHGHIATWMRRPHSLELD